eukprot:6045356-Amphidinium_carterae.1
MTEGGTCMACRNCKRYVTAYQGMRRNLGTLQKQECKPKAKRQAKRAGRAPQKQKGGALPALPPSSLTKGRAKGSNMKPRGPRLTERTEPMAPVVLNGLQALIVLGEEDEAPFPPTGRIRVGGQVAKSSSSVAAASSDPPPALPAGGP